MFFFASLTLPEFSGFLTVLVGMLAGFYALVKFMLKQSEKLNEQHLKIQALDREERKALAEAVNKMADNSGKVAEATERAADEAKERNGHIVEISVENKKQIIKAIHGLTIDKQTVHHQTVENEKVLNKEES